MKEKFLNMLCLIGIVTGLALLYLMAIVGFLLMITGCTTVKEVVKNDTIVHTEYVCRVDSVYLKDSVFLRDSIFIQTKGDTTLIERWHTRYADRWRDRLLRDTCFVRDTVKVKEMVKTQAENKQKKVPSKIALLVFGTLIISVVIIGIIPGRKKI